jgi:hypothetical protein
MYPASSFKHPASRMAQNRMEIGFNCPLSTVNYQLIFTLEN